MNFGAGELLLALALVGHLLAWQWFKAACRACWEPEQAQASWDLNSEGVDPP